MIRYVFVSNFINHHQIPFCNAMQKLTGDSFAFIQVSPMSRERIEMGWNEKDIPPYVVLAYEDKERALQIIFDAEVVIFGGAEDESYIVDRLKAGKKVIRYSERLYRTGQWKAISPRGLRRKYIDHTQYRKKDVQLMCAGAYVPSDFHIVRAYPNKMLRWGYFPELRKYEDTDSLFQKKNTSEILWAARFLPLKHPELALETALYLKNKGHDFHMNIIGGGVMEEEIKQLIGTYDLEQEVSLLGYMTPEEVRDHMEKAAFFLMTSNKEEGWGAVINEAMNSGCPIIANYRIGSVPFLINHGENGFVYKNKEQLFAYAEELLSDSAKREKMGRAALEKIQSEWNPEEAARRLVDFCEKGIWQEDEGPCSHAPVIGERKMYSYMMKKAKTGKNE